MATLLAAAPHADTFGYSMPPPGLLRLGGALRRRGVTVRLEDLAYRLAAGELPGDDRLAEASAALLLADGHVDVIGLSTMGATLPISIAIAEHVRRSAPGVALLLGGPGTTGIDVALLERFPWIDAIVRGEGEETVPDLLERLRDGRGPGGVEGVTWRRSGGSIAREPDRAPIENLDGLADYAWDLLPPIASYKSVTGEDEGLVPLDSGRGCVYDCSFCTIGRYWRRRSRVLPVQRLVSEVRALRDIPGARRAYLCHDIFAADRRHAIDFCRAMIAEHVGVPWEARARVDHLDDELIELMGRAGCYRVLLGIESGDADVRNEHGKRMDRDFDVLHVVAKLGGSGITPILSLILGLPGEDAEALERTLELAQSASLIAGCNLSFHLVNPQPGCGLGADHAAASRPVEGIPPDMALGAGGTRAEQELIAAYPDLFSTFALLTAEPGGAEHLRKLHVLAQTLPEVLMTWPRTFALLRQRAGIGVGDLHRMLLASQATFPAFATASNDALVDDMLAWEQAVARAPGHAEVVRARYDLPRIATGLTVGSDGSNGPTMPPPAPTCLAVVEGQRGVRTLRVSNDVARLCETPIENLGTEEREFLVARGLAPAPLLP